jgi:rhodanese-related sulfurtransferase
LATHPAAKNGMLFATTLTIFKTKPLEEDTMSKKLLVLVMMIALALSTVGAAISAEKAADVVGPKVKAMIDEAKAAIKKVPAETVKAAIDKKEKVVILDVRDSGEFAAGHLPGAINISRGTLEMNVANAITDLDAKVYVYCKTAGRSSLATKTLNDLGYKGAILMDAQYADWVKAGYPVER